MIAKEIGSNNTSMDLKAFTRITPPADELNLILEAPNSDACHALLQTTEDNTLAHDNPPSFIALGQSQQNVGILLSSQTPMQNYR